jgi:RNA polymerase sigma-70 factor (ECF subfamily)
MAQDAALLLGHPTHRFQMPDTALHDARPAVSPEAGATSARLLVRAQRGEQTALSALLARHLPPLQRWAHGRLPRWARTMADTADFVQDAVLNTIRHLRDFDNRGHGALQAYLRKAVENRIADEHRRVARRGSPEELNEATPDKYFPSPIDVAIAAETEARYRRALEGLRPAERQLVVARVELGYSYEQLALLTGRRKTDSARVALHRALIRLAEEMNRV